MKNFTKPILTSAILFSVISFAVNAQQRYYDEIFTQVDVISNVQYGTNYSILTGTPTLDNLLMDVYSPPSSDTVTNRPLIIYIHTGRFLPSLINWHCTGARNDSAVVEICSRFAKRGYVVAAISYRLGWDPLSNDYDTRTGSFTNALYRGIQDAKNAVRYFRNNNLNGGNTYGIDQNNIVLGGQGDAGGYIALAYSTLDNPTELLLDKFRNFYTGEPYIDTTLSGDYNGLQGSAPYNQVNVPNVSSNVHFIFNIGGALVDSSWLQGGEPAMVSFHSPSDPFTPYSFGDVMADPSTGNFLMQVSGSYDVIRNANSLGNQDVWNNTTFNDPYTARANSINNGYEGLFPFIIPDPENEPWEWWDPACAQNDNALLSNPYMSNTRARAYIDTIIGYLNPRIISALQYIPCSAGFNLFPDSLIAHNWFASNTCTSSAPLTYNWHWGDGDSSAGAYPSHIYTTPGYYNICVSINAANGCYDYYCDSSTYIYKSEDEMISVSVVNGLPNGIEEKESYNILIFPNPASSSIIINGEWTMNNGQLRIMNTQGQLVQQLSIINFPLSIDVQHLSPGIYFLSLTDGEQQINKKFIKE